MLQRERSFLTYVLLYFILSFILRNFLYKFTLKTNLRGYFGDTINILKLYISDSLLSFYYTCIYMYNSMHKPRSLGSVRWIGWIPGQWKPGNPEWNQLGDKMAQVYTWAAYHGPAALPLNVTNMARMQTTRKFIRYEHNLHLQILHFYETAIAQCIVFPSQRMKAEEECLAKDTHELTNKGMN